MMKLGFNEATCMRNSMLAQDVVLAERFGYDYIEIRLDMLQEWLQKHTLSELADIFAVGHLKPWGYNSLEDITFCDSESWAEKRRQLAFACHAGSVVGGIVWSWCPPFVRGKFSARGNGERFSEASARDGGSGGRKPDAAGL